MEENKKKLGQEPAFPFFKENESGFGDTIVVYDSCGAKAFYPFEKGMSKRFYAACMAMQGILANSNWAESMRIKDDWDEYKERVASASFEVADELLRQEEL